METDLPQTSLLASTCQANEWYSCLRIESKQDCSDLHFQPIKKGTVLVAEDVGVWCVAFSGSRQNATVLALYS